MPLWLTLLWKRWQLCSKLRATGAMWLGVNRRNQIRLKQEHEHLKKSASVELSGTWRNLFYNLAETWIFDEVKTACNQTSLITLMISPVIVQLIFWLTTLVWHSTEQHHARKNTEIKSAVVRWVDIMVNLSQEHHLADHLKYHQILTWGHSFLLNTDFKGGLGYRKKEEIGSILVLERKT